MQTAGFLDKQILKTTKKMKDVNDQLSEDYDKLDQKVKNNLSVS